MRNDERNVFCCFKLKKLYDEMKMGNIHTSKGDSPLSMEFPRTHNVRVSLRTTKLPMPDQNELERRFTKVLASMDLPPDKAKFLKQYDDEKKWDIICDQERVQAKDPPSHYLSKLRTYLDPKASRSSRKRKTVGDATSTQVLRDLEISLRTNHIEWVREFLNDDNNGLDSLIEYLSFRLIMMRHEQATESQNSSEENFGLTSNGSTGTSSCIGALVGVGVGNHTSYPANSLRPPLDVVGNPSIKRQSRHAAKLNMGDTKDDIHVCIMCLRAIMNNKYGFNMVIQHREAINSIALSLTHKSLRTKALVLELIAAICLVKGGHEIILLAFDNFKEVCQESKRFQTLMDYFINYEIFHIEFMVACMQFVNVVVHSVEDMNFRVHLQYEFSKLGLDEYLEKLRHSESEELQVQISAYLDNVFDVAALMEDSETKTTALEKAAELADELAQAHDRLAELERESLAQLGIVESNLNAIRTERDEFEESKRAMEEELVQLRRLVDDQKQESQSRQSMLEEKIHEFIKQTLPKADAKDIASSLAFLPGVKGLVNNITDPSSAAAIPSPEAPLSIPPPPPLLSFPHASSQPISGLHVTGPPPPPPPPPNLRNGLPIIPLLGMNQPLDGAMTIKRKVQTKYKLPTLNWIALKPNQVRGTVFNEMDEDKLFSVIDFPEFEERFKIAACGKSLTNGSSQVDGLSNFPSKRFKKLDMISLLEHTRLRNMAISRRKIELPIEKITAGINTLDLKQVSLENVEVLQRMIPTDTETKAYREYLSEKNDINLLTEEDKFLFQLSRVERLQVKLSIMSFMGNFLDNIHLITPQVHALISSSSSVKNSKKLRKVLEIILAFGNYMNSAKRGPAYGFRIQSLDSLVETKSNDKRMALLHYIAETIRFKFPEHLNFDSELIYIEKTSTVSLENLVADVTDLEKNMEMVKKECEMRSKDRTGSQNLNILKDFLSNNEEKLKRLRVDLKVAQDAFCECVEYFGESPRMTDANTFFSLLVRFTRSFKVADQDNEQRRRLEAAAQQAAVQNSNEKMCKRNQFKHKKQQQDAVINELKNKVHSVQEKKLLQQDEVYNGALEDILLGLKSEPYRRADAVRRSHRRRIDNNRLSRAMDELEI